MWLSRRKLKLPRKGLLMRLSTLHAVLGLLGLLGLGACGGDDKYRCDVYQLSPYTRFATTWYKASSAGEATNKCENEHPGYACECWQD